MTSTKKAIIVGATSGLGKELAQLFVKDGWQVGITGRRLENLLEIQATAPDKFIVQNWDAAAEDNDKQLDMLLEKMGGLDLLIMNSGIGTPNKYLVFEKERPTIELNVLAFTQIVDWGMRHFIKEKKGQLVGITSIASLRGYKSAPAYNASKAFQASYLEALRQKATSMKLPITVTDIRPGFVETPMTEGQKGMFWVSTCEKAGRQIFSAIKRKASVAYITKRWKIIALFFKLTPRAIYKYF